MNPPFRATTPVRTAGLAAVLLFLASVPLGAQTPPPELAESDEALWRRLEAILSTAEAGGFHGVVLVSRHGKDLLHRGVGLARREPPTPFTPSTIVQIGSNVKDFTKVAIFQLVEAGTLRLEDPVARFFPAAPAEIGVITIDQLVTMRSGLPLGLARDDETLSKPAFLERLWATKLESLPGTRERYSNLGYSVLAAIVEEVTGETFDDYVARTILVPLGLAETGLFRPRFDPARLAHGYAGGVDQGTLFDLPHDGNAHLWALRGNGGWLATVRDQSNLYRALAQGKLLQRDDLRRRVFDPDGAQVHAGSDLVCVFLHGWYPAVGIEIVIASNHQEYTAQRLHRTLEESLGLRPDGRERRVDGAGRRAADSEGTVSLPTDGPWSTVATWFAALESNDDERMRAFFAERTAPNSDAPPIERRLENSRRLRETLRGSRIVGAELVGEALEVRIRLENGDPAQLRFSVDPAPPHLFRGLQVMVG